MPLLCLFPLTFLLKREFRATLKLLAVLNVVKQLLCQIENFWEIDFINLQIKEYIGNIPISDLV